MPAPKKILIADDEEQLALALKIRFQAKGYQVFTAGDGRQTLELITQQQPDLLILDILMPVMDGYTCLREINRRLISLSWRGSRTTSSSPLTTKTSCCASSGSSSGAPRDKPPPPHRPSSIPFANARRVDPRSLARYNTGVMPQPIPLQDAAVYGPIRSRRLGNSLGINVLPVSHKVC
ncbi:MAG: response regulator, partial [Candidatus Omnitrophica bacterium]|nr:response regulator [Candidatus Omnitrophota bacterium]